MEVEAGLTVYRKRINIALLAGHTVTLLAVPNLKLLFVNKM